MSNTIEYEQKDYSCEKCGEELILKINGTKNYTHEYRGIKIDSFNIIKFHQKNLIRTQTIPHELSKPEATIICRSCGWSKNIEDKNIISEYYKELHSIQMEQTQTYAITKDRK